MKERENRESWIRCKRPSPSRCLSIDIFIFICSVITGFLRVRQNLDPRLNPNGPRAIFALAQALQDRIS